MTSICNSEFILQVLRISRVKQESRNFLLHNCRSIRASFYPGTVAHRELFKLKKFLFAMRYSTTL